MQVPVSLQAELPGASAVTGGIDGVQGGVHGVHARLQGPRRAVSQHEGFTWNATHCSQCVWPSCSTLRAASSTASSGPSTPQPGLPRSQTHAAATLLTCLQPSVLPVLPEGAAVQIVGLQGSTWHGPAGYQAVLLNSLHKGGHEERSCAFTTAHMTQPPGRPSAA